eukprot:2390008-Amphidinium_carterae.1
MMYRTSSLATTSSAGTAAASCFYPYTEGKDGRTCVMMMQPPHICIFRALHAIHIHMHGASPELVSDASIHRAAHARRLSRRVCVRSPPCSRRIPQRQHRQ